MERRKVAGNLQEDFQLEKVQVLVKPNGLPLVRLNKEVEAEAVVRLMPGIKKKGEDY
jgi:hypothetical protein